MNDTMFDEDGTPLPPRCTLTLCVRIRIGDRSVERELTITDTDSDPATILEYFKILTARLNEELSA